MPKKKPDVMETRVGGGSVDDRVDFAPRDDRERRRTRHERRVPRRRVRRRERRHERERDPGSRQAMGRPETKGQTRPAGMAPPHR